jgi:hypothetical protein
VLEQRRVHRGVREVVDGDHLDLDFTLEKRLEGLTTDPAESIDPDSH